jgi:hypothetical protein
MANGEQCAAIVDRRAAFSYRPNFRATQVSPLLAFQNQLFSEPLNGHSAKTHSSRFAMADQSMTTSCASAGATFTMKQVSPNNKKKRPRMRLPATNVE